MIKLCNSQQRTSEGRYIVFDWAVCRVKAIVDDEWDEQKKCSMIDTYISWVIRTQSLDAPQAKSTQHTQHKNKQQERVKF